MLARIALRARKLVLSAALALAAFAPAFAQQPAEQPQPDTEQTQPRQTPVAALEPVKLTLDQIQATLRRSDLSLETLGELESSLTPVRDNLRARLADLEKRLAQIDERRKQFGPPAPGAPPESPAITAERARLDQFYSNVDAGVKLARLLIARADALADRIAERRRDLFAQNLLQRSSSVLDPFFWTEVAKTIPAEAHSVGVVLQSWWSYARDNGGPARIAAAAATLLGAAIGILVFVRWWRRRFSGRTLRDTRSAKALACLWVFLRDALTMPLIVAGVLQILESFDLVPNRIQEIANALVIATAVGAFGRAVARAVLAPDRPERRIAPFVDRTAQLLSSHMTWASRALGLAVFLLALHRALVSVAILPIGTRMLLSLAVVILLLHLLIELRQRHEATETETGAPPPWLWARALGWLLVIGIAVSLVGGYAGLAYFLAERLLATVAIVATFYLLIAVSDALFGDFLTTETPRGRALAINFGLHPRHLEMIGVLLAGSVRVLLVACALLLLVGPWQVSTASFIDRLKGVTLGFELGGITFSFGTLLGAVAVLVLVLAVTRALQRWTERQFLPRTNLDPSLQLSIVTIFGYLGVIAAISFAMAQLGIDLQKIAFIAGALSVGIGFGLQAIVSNFVSGLILLAERPIRVGDQIVVKGEEGIVRRISVRATEIQTGDQGSVIVPNTELITGLVKNRTHANMWGQIIIRVGVSYDSDPEQVRDILMESTREHPKVVKSSAPSVQLASLGDNALQFEVYAVIVELSQGGPIKSDIHFAILKRLRAAGIKIAYPQREVRLVGDGPAEPASPAKP